MIRKSRVCMTTCAAFALAGILGLSRAADDKPAGKDQKGGPPDMEAMMKKMQEVATPGAAHKVLDALAGEWAAESKFCMGGPDAPPTESKGTAKKKWILGGRFLQEEYEGEMMGQSFHGIGLLGYDNFKQKYVSSWIDNMGTCLTTSEGTADSARKVLTMVGKMDDPMTGEKDKTLKTIVRILGPDKHVVEIHDLSLGEKSKMGEITYVRK